MFEINTKEIKKIESLLNEVAFLLAEKEQLAEKKNSLSLDEHKDLTNKNRDRLKEVKGEITLFKRNCTKHLDIVQKQIKALEREERGLNRELQDIEAALATGEGDKNELTVEKRTIKERAKSLARELNQNKKEELLLNKGLELFIIDDREETKKKQVPIVSKKEKINPLYAAGAIGSVIIILLIIVYSTFFRNEKPVETTDQETSNEVMPAVKENTTEEMNASGTITGSNVNMRQLPNVMSAVIKQLQKDDRVQISQKQIVNEFDDAVLSQSTQITTESGEKIKLDPGKGIVIIEERENSFVISYAIDDMQSIKGTVPKDTVKRISGDTWYLVKNSAGLQGWVYGKYVDLD
jgi:hypothetical protein